MSWQKVRQWSKYSGNKKNLKRQVMQSSVVPIFRKTEILIEIRTVADSLLFKQTHFIKFVHVLAEQVAYHG